MKYILALIVVALSLSAFAQDGVLSVQNGTVTKGSVPTSSIPDLSGAYVARNAGFGTNITFNGLTLKNNVDSDQFIYLRSGLAADQRDYFYWLDFNGGSAWAFGRNSVNTLICFDSVNATHRSEYEAGGISYISSGGSSPVVVNGQGESGTGTGGLRVRSGGASPVTWLQVDSNGTIFANHADIDYFLTVDSGTSSANRTAFAFLDRGSSKYFFGRNADNTFVLYDYTIGGYVFSFDSGNLGGYVNSGQIFTFTNKSAGAGNVGAIVAGSGQKKQW